MATAFIATVKSSSGDYTSLSAAEAGLQNDLTAGDIKVFSISSATSPTIAAGDSVLGLTSAATGTCVLVNAANTQILIKSITGTFQNGETVKKLTDITKEVVLSNAGDSPFIEIDCYASAAPDTTAVVINGWTTSATNYILITAPAGERHNGTYSTSKYRLEYTNTTNGTSAIEVGEDFVTLDGLQEFTILSSDIASYGISTSISGVNSGAQLRIQHCIIRVSVPVSGTRHDSISMSAYASGTRTLFLSNSLLYDNFNTGYGTNVPLIELEDQSVAYLYNNTLAHSDTGLRLTNNGYGAALPVVIMKNTLFTTVATPAITGNTYAAGTDYNATNLSSIGYTVTGSGNTHDRLSQTFTFVNAGAFDFHLDPSDGGAKTFGVDLSADSNLPITDDIDYTTRTVPWDIGMDQVSASIPSADPFKNNRFYQLMGVGT